MSIRLLRESLADIPGAHELTMSYEDGGRVQAFSFAGRVVRLPASAGLKEIEAQLRQVIGASA